MAENQIADPSKPQGGNNPGTMGITGSQAATADSVIPPDGTAAAFGAMSITGSITSETPDRYAGGAPKDFPK